MYRLRGSDAQHIYNETPNSPFETLKVTVYEATSPDTPIDIAELTKFLKDSVRNTPTETMSMRVMRVPLDLHHPVWVKDPNYCLDDHYYHIALPAPGGKQQLCDFISTLLSRPLYANRPLWETWIVEGLEGGRVAAVSKVHHVLADGLTSVKGLARMHAQNPAPAAEKPLASIGELPSRRRLMFDALIELVKSFTVELPTYWRHIKKKRENSAALKDAEPNLCVPFQAPHTVLNELGGPYRYFHYDMYSFKEIKALSKRFDCTINTMIMGLCSEAFRRYFLEIDQLPSEPLVSVMPVGLASDGELKGLFNTEIHNNSLTFVLIPFDLSKVDFKERLAEIQRASKIGVENVKKAEGYRLDNFFDFLPGGLIRLGNAVLSWRQRKRKNPMANIGISNVPGPRETMYACNGKYKVAELLSCGNLADLGNFSLTIWSYDGQMCFSFHYRKGPIPKPHRINEHLEDVINEMLEQEGIKP